MNKKAKKFLSQQRKDEEVVSQCVEAIRSLNRRFLISNVKVSYEDFYIAIDFIHDNLDKTVPEIREMYSNRIGFVGKKMEKHILDNANMKKNEPISWDVVTITSIIVPLVSFRKDREDEQDAVSLAKKAFKDYNNEC